MNTREVSIVRGFGIVTLGTNDQELEYGVTPWTGTDPRGPLRYGWSLLEAGPLFERTLAWALPALEPVDAYIGLFSDGVLAMSRLEDDLLSVPELAGFVDARLTAHVSPEGHELLAVTTDGRVDVIRFDAGVPERRRLAALAIPEGHFLLGAARFEDRLVVAAQARSGPDDTLLGLRNVGQLRFFAADLPEGSPEAGGAPIPFLAAGAITARFSGNDLLVCWPPTSEPLVTEGWTLGGAPVHGVVPVTPGCALALRDLRFSSGYEVETPPPPYWGTAVAVIPGVGRTLLVAPPPASFGSEPWLPQGGRRGAPLADGGLVTFSHIYAPGGVPLGGIRHALYPTTLCDLLPDLTGAGHWAACDDGINNDQEGYPDCSDADCDGAPCNPGEPTTTCGWGICAIPANCI